MKTRTIPEGSITNRVQQRHTFIVGDGTSINYLCKSGIYFFLFASGSVKVLIENDVWCSFDSSAAENKAIVLRLQQSRGQVVVKEADEEDLIRYVIGRRCCSFNVTQIYSAFVFFSHFKIETISLVLITSTCSNVYSLGPFSLVLTTSKASLDLFWTCF